MRRNQRSLLRLGLRLGISILAVLTLSSALLGQVSREAAAAGPAISDWSNHHVVFSKPATAEQAARVAQDPRYWQQIRRQSPAAAAVEADRAQTDRLVNDRVIASEWRNHRPRSAPPAKQGLNGLWSENMGTGATVGAGNYPAKYSVYVNKASCTTDFVVYSTGLPGASGQASLVAYSNLYSGCSTDGSPVPSVYWAYDTFATVETSPIFSFDGTRMAVVQQNAAGHAVLMLLKWKASTTESITTPGRPRQVRPAQFQTCTAPCKTLFFLNDLISSVSMPAGDTESSVFLDYHNDAAYVGDSLGFLHKFSPVFEGAPAEVTTGGWPVQVNPGSLTPTLTSPVHDAGSGNVFVEDKGGFLYSVNPSAVVTQSGLLDSSTVNDSGPGFVQGPIVDSVSGQVYVFATSDGSGFCPGGADCSGVYQLTTSFTAGDFGSEAVVGNSTIEPATPSPMYIGAFDSTYESSVNATGHLYVCGNTGGSPTVYQVSIGSGVLGTVTAGPILATSTTPCSPATDVLNPNVTGGATEWVFASAENEGNSSGCSTGGCIFNFKDTPWEALSPYTVGQEVLDYNLHIEVVEVGGLSGASAPFWNNAPGGATLGDGTVKWLDQGAATVVTPAAWAPATKYSKGAVILDSNLNVELVTNAATHGSISGATVPAFTTVPGSTKTDGTSVPPITWTNVGAIATANLPAAGGTSGIIIDNFVNALTEPGASQIYFSTLSNQTCGASPTPGGCAVQASQSALQ